MSVVTTGVVKSRKCADVGNVGLFLEWEGIHVRTQENGRLAGGGDGGRGARDGRNHSVASVHLGVGNCNGIGTQKIVQGSRRPSLVR